MLESQLPDIPQSAHFIGIGGAGMSGIALVLHERGCKTTGSDLKPSHYVRELEDAGIDITIGHEAQTIDRVDPEVVVCSTAIPETNPELIRAREKGIQVWPRAKMLSALSKGAKTIAIAGTHGKTTTSSMTATMMDRMGLDPSFLIGGVVEGYNTNGKNGNSKYFVAEADESDGSFLYLAPNVVVVTNIEADHLDHYGSLEAIEQTFVKFMESVGIDGVVIVCGESPRLVELAHSTGRKVLTYGFDEACDYVVSGSQRGHSLAMDLQVKTPEHGTHAICIKANPGRHNMLNATAAFAVADVCDLDLDAAAEGLSQFKGVRRRFTHMGDVDGVCVVDDYGHHPTEVKATISAAKNLDFDRLVVVFQPHRYSRTRDLAGEFASAFDGVDKLYVMDVFAASETPIPGISGKTIVNEILKHDPDTDVVYVPNKRSLVQTLSEDTRPGDLLITMGAGDVTQVGPRFIDAKKELDK